MKRKTVRALVRGVTGLLANVDAHGVDNLPDSGPCVVVSNHLGRLDGVLAYSFANRDDVIMLVAEKYKKNPLFRFVVEQMDGIFVDRFNADMVALRKALSRLKEGCMLVVAPEGTRSPTETLQEGKAGATFLAMKANAPIIPVGVYGSEDSAARAAWKRLRRPHIIAHTGKPFTLPSYKGVDRDLAVQQATEEIMCRIAAQLPPRYRGVYANHPRLQELLEQMPEIEY